jgi:hypothetical protein
LPENFRELSKKSLSKLNTKCIISLTSRSPTSRRIRENSPGTKQRIGMFVEKAPTSDRRSSAGNRGEFLIHAPTIYIFQFAIFNRAIFDDIEKSSSLFDFILKKNSSI